MLDVLDAPVPFLVGVHSSYVEVSPGGQGEVPPGVVLVELDDDRVVLGLDEETRQPMTLPQLPAREEANTFAHLDPHPNFNPILTLPSIEPKS